VTRKQPDAIDHGSSLGSLSAGEGAKGEPPRKTPPPPVDHASTSLRGDGQDIQYLNGLLDILRIELAKADAAAQAVAHVNSRLKHDDSSEVDFGDAEVLEDVRRVSRISTMSALIDLLGAGSYKEEIMRHLIASQFGAAGYSSVDDGFDQVTGQLNGLRESISGLSEHMGFLRQLTRTVSLRKYNPSMYEKHGRKTAKFARPPARDNR